MIACEQALGLGVWVFLGGRGWGRERPRACSQANWMIKNNAFHKFVPRERKQGKINSGKFFTYQSGVKWIAPGKTPSPFLFYVIFSVFFFVSVARNSLHPRLVSRKFATVYLPLLPLPQNKFMKGHCLLSSNRPPIGKEQTAWLLEPGKRYFYRTFELRLLDFLIIFGF